MAEIVLAVALVIAAPSAAVAAYFAYRAAQAANEAAAVSWEVVRDARRFDPPRPRRVS